MNGAGIFGWHDAVGLRYGRDPRQVPGGGVRGERLADWSYQVADPVGELWAWHPSKPLAGDLFITHDIRSRSRFETSNGSFPASIFRDRSRTWALKETGVPVRRPVSTT